MTLKNDAAENVFLSQQLTYFEKTLYSELRPANKSRKLIPTDFNIPSGAKSIAYDVYSEFGNAAIVGSDPTDIPLVGVKATRSTGPVKTIANGYVITLEDIEAARFSGIPLDTMLPMKAREVLLRKEDSLAFAGDAVHGLDGFNLSSLDNEVVATVSGATTWAAKLAAGDGAYAVIADIAEAANEIMNEVGDQEELYADTIVMPPVQFGLLARTPMPGNPATTVLQFVLSTDPHIKNIEPWSKLTASGTGSADQFIMYRRDPSVVRMRIAMDVEQRPPEARGFGYQINLRSKFGGVHWYQPLAARKRYGI
jgi:hypothetical protein